MNQPGGGGQEKGKREDEWRGGKRGEERREERNEERGGMKRSRRAKR